MKVKQSWALVLSSVLALNSLNATDMSKHELNNVVDTEMDSAAHLTWNQEAWRKINISQFLHNLAATIYNVGQAATAETMREKQRAAFGIVTSLLNLAADASAKKDQKNQQHELPIDADDEMIETRTVDIVVRVLDLLDNAQFRSIKSDESVLNEFQSVASSDERRHFITEKLRTDEGRAAVMGASLNALKKAVEKRILSITQTFRNSHVRSCEEDEGNGQLIDEITSQPTPDDVTGWWENLVTFTTQNSLVVALHHGFQDIYNYVYNFFTNPSNTAQDSQNDTASDSNNE